MDSNVRLMMLIGLSAFDIVHPSDTQQCTASGTCKGDAPALDPGMHWNVMAQHVMDPKGTLQQRKSNTQDPLVCAILPVSAGRLVADHAGA